MDILRALGVSASGLTAQRTRMDAISENVANTETTRSADGRPYRRKLVLLETVANDPTALFAAHSRDAAVRVRDVVDSQEPFRRVFRPEHPHAGPDGFVALPNVNPLREMVDMLSTTRAYEANAVAFQAAKTMGAKLLELLR